MIHVGIEDQRVIEQQRNINDAKRNAQRYYKRASDSRSLPSLTSLRQKEEEHPTKDLMVQLFSRKLDCFQSAQQDQIKGKVILFYDQSLDRSQVQPLKVSEQIKGLDQRINQLKNEMYSNIDNPSFTDAYMTLNNSIKSHQKNQSQNILILTQLQQQSKDLEEKQVNYKHGEKHVIQKRRDEREKSYRNVYKRILFKREMPQEFHRILYKTPKLIVHSRDKPFEKFPKSQDIHVERVLTKEGVPHKIQPFIPSFKPQQDKQFEIVNTYLVNKEFRPERISAQSLPKLAALKTILQKRKPNDRSYNILQAN